MEEIEGDSDGVVTMKNGFVILMIMLIIGFTIFITIKERKERNETDRQQLEAINDYWVKQKAINDENEAKRKELEFMCEKYADTPLKDSPVKCVTYFLDKYQ